MAIKYLKDLNCEGKKVLLRVDFNVPLDKKSGEITDTSRVDLALPTIKKILSQSPKCLIIMSHLGRPNGERNTKFSLAPVAEYLSSHLDDEVIFTEAAVDAGVKELVGLNTTKVVLLENLRFHPEEKNNDENFAGKLASYADLYVNDAFGAAHRKHASVHMINKFFTGRAYAGLLMQKEIEALDKILKTPQKPFVSIVGGAKVSDKIGTLQRLLVLSNNILIGGAMAYPFLKAQGHEVGKSLCSDEDLKLAQSILKNDKGNKIKLPLDHLCAASPESTDVSTTSDQNIEKDLMGLDIGPKTIELYQSIITEAKSVLWNGPMGFFEKEAFAKGTFCVAEALSKSGAYTLVGGGDSVSAIKKSGFADQVSHISTGGGASLEYIEKGQLPGLQVLRFGV